MTRITFRFPADIPESESQLWGRRAFWLQKQATAQGCFIDTNVDFVCPFLTDDGQRGDLVLMIPEPQGSWCPDPAPELREWITELSFEIVEAANETA